MEASVDVLVAVDRAKILGLCLRRIWAVATSLPAKENSLPKLIPPPDIISNPIATTQHQEHEQCTFDFCEQSRIDFTFVKQRHEQSHGKTGCQGDCQRLEFPLILLHAQAREGRPAVWKLYDQSLLDISNPYMAISHVWADGTGTGAWGPGKVHECLYEFFCDIARGFQCEGCWWDTISIPSDDEARAKALANMHNNYANARITLVHDLYLRSWEWIDAETACFAVVMSPWYSRGWTALELAKSHKVKILFKAKNGQQVIKDLDIDILHKIQSTSPHFDTAKSIRKLRGDSIKTLSDLLAVLGPRDTSKPRDMPIISGLLAGVDVYGGLSQQEIYQRILRKLGNVTQGHLFHNSATMSTPGFSWCPTNIFDMPIDAKDSGPLEIQENGDVEGEWNVYEINSVDKQDLNWKDTHLLMKVFLESALLGQKKDHHLFLLEDGGCQNRALLVKLMNDGGTTPCCRFIGPVYFRKAIGGLDCAIPCYHQIKVRIGSTEGMEEVQESAWKHLLLKKGEPRQGRCSTQDATLEKTGSTSQKNTHPDSSYTPSSTGKAILYQRLKTLGWPFDGQSEKTIRLSDAESSTMELRVHYETVDDKPSSSINTFFYGHRKITGHIKNWLKEQGRNSQGLLLDDDLILLNVDKSKVTVDKMDEKTRNSLAGEALSLAVKEGSFEQSPALITLLLDNHAEHICEPGPMGFRPLHRAVERQSLEMIKRLLMNETNPASADEPSKKGQTALHLAAEKCSEAPLARLLVEKSSKFKTETNSDMMTALHVAAMSGNHTVSEVLLAGGANTTLQDLQKHTALQHAVKGNHRDVVAVILKHALSNDCQSAAFHQVTTSVNEETSSDSGEQMSRRSARNDFINDMKKALCLAASSGFIEIVKQLCFQQGDDCFEQKDHYFQKEDLNKALLKAAEKNHRDVIKELVRVRAVSGMQDDKGMTALHWAIKNEDDDNAKLLIQNDALLDRQDKKNQSPLLLALDQGRESVVTALLEREDCEVTAGFCNSDGQTTLHLAAKQSYEEAAMKLLEFKQFKKPKVMAEELSAESVTSEDSLPTVVKPEQYLLNAQDSMGRTALHWAAFSGSIKIINSMIDNDAHYNDVDNEDRTALVLAVDMGQEHAVKELVKRGSSTNTISKDKMTVLDRAAKFGHEGIVETLLPYFKDDQTKISALTLAANEGNLSVAVRIHRKITESTLKVSATTPILFSASATSQYSSEVKEFIKRIRDVNVTRSENRQTALMLSVKHGNYELVRTLLNRGADVDAKDESGTTALMMAVKAQNPHIVRELLLNGADTSVHNNAGWTILHYAAARLSRYILRLILDCNQNLIISKDAYGRTALHIALQSGMYDGQTYGGDVLMHWRTLLRWGASIYVKDEDGKSPLHLAILSGEHVALDLLDFETHSKEAETDGMRDAERQNSLLLAAESGYSELVRRLGKSYPNATDRDGRTALMLAAGKGHHHIVLQLLEIEADPNIPDHQGRTALSQAARHGHFNVVFSLLIYTFTELNLDARDNMGRTALLLAADNGHWRIVEELLDQQADANIMDHGGKKAWQRALQKGHVSIVQMLLSAHKQPIESINDINEALLLASRKGWAELVNVLIIQRADTSFQNSEGWTALHLATMNGHQAVARRLVAEGRMLAIEDNTGRTALLQATERGFASIVRVLLEKQDVVSNITFWKGPEALLLAADRGYYEIAKLLVNTGVDPNVLDSTGKTAISLAAANGHSEIVQLLLSFAADVGIKDEHKRTALHYAARGGFDSAVAFLLPDNTALRDLKDNLGQSALHLAAESGSKEVIKQLLDHGADLNATSADGQTALHRAAWGGSDEAVDQLLKGGADANIRDHSKARPWQTAAEKGHESIVEVLLGETGLHDERISNKQALLFAAQMGYEGIAKSLLDRGMRTTVEDEDGLTPLHWAMKQGNAALVVLISSKEKVVIDALDNRGQTPLCHGVLEGHIEAVKKLLEKSAGIDIADKEKQTALHHAARNGDREMVETLVKHNADPHARNTSGKKAWELAAQKGYHDIVSPLLEKELNFRPKSQSAKELFLEMARRGQTAMVHILLDKEVEINTKDRLGRTAIGLAAEFQKKEVLDLLLLKGANPCLADLRRQTPLLWAAKAGNIRMVNSLLDYGSMLPRRSTATNGSTQTETVDEFSLINHTDCERRTALLLAMKGGFDEVAQVFLKKRLRELDVNVRDITGETALHIAAERGKQDLVRMLLDKHAKPTLKDQWGQTAILRAAKQGNDDVVDILLEHRSGPESSRIEDSQGQTALLLGVEKGDAKMVQKLLKRNGNTDDADNADDAEHAEGVDDANNANDADDAEETIDEDGADNREVLKLEHRALLAAAENGHTHIVDLLFENSLYSQGTEETDKILFQALSLASANGDAEAVKTLFKYTKARWKADSVNGAELSGLAKASGSKEVYWLVGQRIDEACGGSQ